MSIRVKWYIVAWALLAVFSSSAVCAQSETETASKPPGFAHDLKLPVMVWIASVTADQVTTYQFSSRYRDMIHEENPLLHGLERHPALLVGAGAALDAATGWASYRLLQNHPRLAQIVFYGAAGYRTYLALHNVQMMRQADVLRMRLIPSAAFPQ
jgi:hypothetical protein